MPPALAGVALLSGVFDASAYGSAPLAGVILGGATSLTYAAFILVFRRAVTGVPHAVTPLLHMSVTAAMASCALGPATGGVDLVPAWPGHGWLIALAFTAQIAAWLLIGYALPRQSASSPRCSCSCSRWARSSSRGRRSANAPPRSSSSGAGSSWRPSRTRP
nr:hypothetical protein GCM10020093_106320 [Planobispora longispora]